MQITYPSNNDLRERILVVEHFNPISIQITTVSSYKLADLVFGLLKFTGDALTKVKVGLQKTWDGIKAGAQYIANTIVEAIYASYAEIYRNLFFIFAQIFSLVTSTNGYVERSRNTITVTNSETGSSELFVVSSDAVGIYVSTSQKEVKLLNPLINLKYQETLSVSEESFAFMHISALFGIFATTILTTKFLEPNKPQQILTILAAAGLIFGYLAIAANMAKQYNLLNEFTADISEFMYKLSLGIFTSITTDGVKFNSLIIYKLGLETTYTVKTEIVDQMISTNSMNWKSTLTSVAGKTSVSLIVLFLSQIFEEFLGENNNPSRFLLLIFLGLTLSIALGYEIISHLFFGG